VATKTLITAEELEVMPGCERCELIRGEIRERPFLGGLGGRAYARLIAEIGRFNQGDWLGTLYGRAGHVLARDPDTVLGPHISFARAGSTPESEWDGFLHQAPELAFEIVAPDEGFIAFFERVAILHSAGVPLIWVIDTFCNRVFIWRTDGNAQTLTKSDTLDGEHVLPGFRLPLTDVFR